jgi:hypothetical protein
MENHICKQCGVEFIGRANRKFCSRDCINKWKSENWIGENNHRWKGGILKPHNGYVYVKTGYRQYRLQHIIVMEDHIGRSLSKCEVVHHKDGNKQNNSIGNLELMTRSEHMKLHQKKRGRIGPSESKCDNCGSVIMVNGYSSSEFNYCSKRCHYDHRRSLPRGRSYHSISVLVEIGSEVFEFPTQEKASEFLGRHKNYVGQVLNGRIKMPKGVKITRGRKHGEEF